MSAGELVDLPLALGNLRVPGDPGADSGTWQAAEIASPSELAEHIMGIRVTRQPLNAWRGRVSFDPRGTYLMCNGGRCHAAPFLLDQGSIAVPAPEDDEEGTGLRNTHTFMHACERTSAGVGTHESTCERTQVCANTLRVCIPSYVRMDIF